MKKKEGGGHSGKKMEKCRMERNTRNQRTKEKETTKQSRAVGEGMESSAKKTKSTSSITIRLSEDRNKVCGEQEEEGEKEGDDGRKRNEQHTEAVMSGESESFLLRALIEERQKGCSQRDREREQDQRR